MRAIKMGYTCNITFVTDPRKENQLLDFLSSTLMPKVFKDGSPAKRPSLKKVVEAGGEKPASDHGLSIALSAELESEETAHLWSDHFLMPALEEFHKSFGQEAVYFITLLENLPLSE